MLKIKKILDYLNINSGNHVRKTAYIIESALESYGVSGKIMEVNQRKNDDEYCFQMAPGSSSSIVLDHKRDLAIAVASSTGTLEIQAPIPGRNLIGFYIPRSHIRPEDFELKKPKVIDFYWSNNPIRSTVGQFLMNASYILYQYALKIGKIYTYKH